MKKVFFMMSLALMAIFVISCTNDNLMEDVNDIRVESPSHRLTAEQAGQNALDFVKKFKTETRAGRTDLKISEIKAIGNNNEVTRSNGSVCFDSLFYVVNFADNQGFVIAAADDRDETIFAYVEEGNYEEETTNNGFDEFMDALCSLQTSRGIQRFDTQEEFMVIDPNEGDANRFYLFEVMSPLLVTKWGQWTYNTYCPQNTPTGCVPTAISQICSFLNEPDTIRWSQNFESGQSRIDWDRIVNECSSFSWGNVYSADLRNQIAHLMRFWGVVFSAKYNSNGTSVNSKTAISKIRDYGINATNLTNYNVENVMNDLKKSNRIVYMHGRDEADDSGHAWVVDGYIHEIRNGRGYIYIHCNWGWGGRNNGYFLGSVLNAGEGPVYNDDGQKTRSSQEPTYNYTNNLKYSTISK